MSHIDSGFPCGFLREERVKQIVCGDRWADVDDRRATTGRAVADDLYGAAASRAPRPTRAQLHQQRALPVGGPGVCLGGRRERPARIGGGSHHAPEAFGQPCPGLKPLVTHHDPHPPSARRHAPQRVEIAAAVAVDRVGQP